MSTEDQVREMSVEIGMHHRLDPMTSHDRCTCGHKLELGQMFSEHVAKQLVARGWKKR